MFQVFDDNPMDDFVELPEQYQRLSYSSMLCGVFRGALEMVSHVLVLQRLNNARFRVFFVLREGSGFLGLHYDPTRKARRRRCLLCASILLDLCGSCRSCFLAFFMT
jgi:hypothetical protein